MFKKDKKMIKSLVISLAKKYIISSLNDLLEKNKENVGYICGKINYWTTKLTVIVELLKRISSRCSDGNLNDTEVDQTVEEIEKIIKEF